MKGQQITTELGSPHLEQLSDLPNEWKIVRIGDIVNYHQQGYYTKNKYGEKGVLLLRISDITDDCQINYDMIPSLEAPEKDIRTFNLRVGDLVVARSGSIGRCAVFEHENLTCLFGAYLIRFRFKPGISPHYVKFFLMSDWGRRQLEAGSHRAAQVDISAEAIKSIEIPLPSLRTQERIVTALRRTLRIKEIREQANQLTNKIIQSVFLKMFGDPATNPMDWDMSRLTELVRIMGGGTPSTSNPLYWKGSIPWVSPKDMKTLVIADSIDHVSEQAVATGKTKLIPQESVLVVIRSGILKRLLPIAVNSVPIAINQDLKALIPRVRIDPYYLLFHLMAMSRDLLKTVKGTTADNISTSILRETRIMVPPYQSQGRFSKIAKMIFQVTERQERSTAENNDLFHSLMQKAFRGELVD
jgi:type I restriction enzyme S subunit